MATRTPTMLASIEGQATSSGAKARAARATSSGTQPEIAAPSRFSGKLHVQSVSPATTRCALQGVARRRAHDGLGCAATTLHKRSAVPVAPPTRLYETVRM